MSTNQRGIEEPGEPRPARRRRLVLLVLVVVVVVAGLVWWRGSSDEPGKQTLVERLAAVPGVDSAGVADGTRVVLLAPDLDRAARVEAIDGVADVLGTDGAVRMGVAGLEDADGTPRAEVHVDGESGDGAEVLADVLPVLATAVSGEATSARASSLPSGLLVELSAPRSAVVPAVGFARAVGDAGLGSRVTDVDVYSDVESDAPGGFLEVECPTGLERTAPALAAVRRLERTTGAVVVSGSVEECGREVVLDAVVSGRDDVSDVRRAARAELGRGATVNVVVDGGPQVSGTGDEEVSLRLVDELEAVGAEVVRVAGVWSGTVRVDDLAGYADALRVFAAAAPARDRRFSATLADGASYSGPVGALERTLPLLRRLDADGWRTFYSGDDPDALSVVTGVFDTGVRRHDLTTAPDRRRLIRLLRDGGWPDDLNLSVGGFGDTPGGAGTELTFTSRVDGRARNVVEAGGPSNRDGLLGSRSFVDEWDASAGS